MVLVFSGLMESILIALGSIGVYVILLELLKLIAGILLLILCRPYSCLTLGIMRSLSPLSPLTSIFMKILKVYIFLILYWILIRICML